MHGVEASQDGVTPVVPPVRLLGQRHSQVQDQEGGLELLGRAQRDDGLVDRAGSRRLVGGGQRVGRPPHAVAQAFGDRRVHRVRAQPAVVQVLAQFGQDLRVVVVDVRAGREDLDGAEPVCRNLHQMVPVEPCVVVEMRGHAELHGTSGVGPSCSHKPQSNSWAARDRETRSRLS